MYLFVEWWITGYYAQLMDSVDSRLLGSITLCNKSSNIIIRKWEVLSGNGRCFIFGRNFKPGLKQTVVESE